MRPVVLVLPLALPIVPRECRWRARECRE